MTTAKSECGRYASPIGDKLSALLWPDDVVPFWVDGEFSIPLFRGIQNIMPAVLVGPLHKEVFFTWRSVSNLADKALLGFQYAVMHRRFRVATRSSGADDRCVVARLGYMLCHEKARFDYGMIRNTCCE